MLYLFFAIKYKVMVWINGTSLLNWMRLVLLQQHCLVYNDSDINVVFHSSGGIRMENSCWPPFQATLPSKIAICASWLTNSTRERTPARSTDAAVSFQLTRGPSGWNRNVPRTTVDGGGGMEKHLHYLLHAWPLRMTHYLTFRVSQWRISWTRFIQKCFRWLKLKHKGCTVET